MFKLVEERTINGYFTLYCNGRILSQAVFRDKKRPQRIYVDDYPKFDIKRISKMKAVDFPDWFHLRFTAKKAFEHEFDLFDIARKGNIITIIMFASHDGEHSAWSLWHPYHFINTANKLAKKRGYRVSEYDIEEYLLFEMDFKVELTIGKLFDKAISQLHRLLEDTDKELLKRLKRKHPSLQRR